MADSGGWWSFTRRFVALFTQQEVKTPLSFMFRALLVLVAVLGLILYAPIPAEYKVKIVGYFLLVLVGLCGLVFLFAWFRPRNLVYGEAGHRAERRMEYGTEKRSLSHEEAQALRPMRDRKQLRS